MASMLRVAGVPARVVAGYQGGTMGLFGEYLIVRNLDAHAWVEYWSERKGAWVRQDPTQWVAPERLRLGGAAYREAYLQGRLGDDNLQVEGGRCGRTVVSYVCPRAVDVGHGGVVLGKLRVNL